MRTHLAVLALALTLTACGDDDPISSGGADEKPDDSSVTASETEATADVVTRRGDFGSDVVVRHIIGLDPNRRGVAIASKVDEGMRLAFCRRNVEAARADLVRICSEIREELEP